VIFPGWRQFCAFFCLCLDAAGWATGMASSLGVRCRCPFGGVCPVESIIKHRILGMVGRAVQKMGLPILTICNVICRVFAQGVAFLSHDALKFLVAFIFCA